MKHFELAEWTDFVRGLIEKSARLPLEHHLASGCRKCRHTADLLRKLVIAAHSDSQVQVPDSALPRPRALFLPPQPHKRPTLAPPPPPPPHPTPRPPSP